MRLVIDIPDWYYDELQEFKHPDFIDKAIRDGVILPKGHGRLIDADATKCSSCGKFGCENSDLCSLYNALTIIEADEESAHEE